MESRIPMFRAILAYHVYTAIFDWRVLSPPQQDRISEGLSRRRAILQTLEKSEADIINRAHLIYNLLERESRPHISPEGSTNPLYEESLRQIAKEVVSLSLTLGMQADAFKFEFRNKDSDETTPTNMLAVRLLGEPGTNNDTMEIVNGMDGTIRALVSPGITRISKTRKENVIRKAQVFTA
ncbi:hypothetical protein H072_3072 [Dactylellina haptotyla CBS 200.50]|uniref:Uncharacterized protein n=1 Tax=Dactylellina haptotyla (strain CBS 200.50) TaxID=1284197 RepID=S8AJ18_DACHA|nr:hypothetical protein H072_3072 [Dactylellina haptotyla CBS 200.50]